MTFVLAATEPVVSHPCAERVPPSFQIEIIHTGHTALASISGPLDIESTPRFLEETRTWCKPERRLVVDLHQAEYVDSAGVRALMVLHERLTAAEGELRLVVPSGSRVERTLKILQLQDHFKIYDAAADACGSGSRSA